MLSRLDALSNRTLSAVTNTLTRLLSDVPGAKGFFWQLSLFHTFEKIFNYCKVAVVGPVSQEKKDSITKIRNLITHILADFFKSAEKDESLYIKIFCWRSKGTNRSLASSKGAVFGDDTEDVMPLEEEERRDEEEKRKNKDTMKGKNKSKSSNENEDAAIDKDIYETVPSEKVNVEDSAKELKKANNVFDDENNTLEDIFSVQENEEKGNAEKRSDGSDSEKDKKKKSHKKKKLHRLVKGGNDNDENDDDDDDEDDDFGFEPVKKKKKKN